MIDGFVKTWPRILLQVEGACIFGSTIWAYSQFERSLWTFAALLLILDLGIAGYLANTSVGVAIYNTFHTEAPPLFLLYTALARKENAVAGLALTWLAHIGMNRILGFGLEYGSSVGHTHVGVFDKKGEKTIASQ